MKRMCAQNIACKDDSFTYMEKMWSERKVGRKKKTSHLFFLQQHIDTPLKKLTYIQSLGHPRSHGNNMKI